MATKTKIQTHVLAIIGAVALLLAIPGPAVLILPVCHLLVRFSLHPEGIHPYKENELGCPAETGLKIQFAIAIQFKRKRQKNRFISPHPM